MDPKIIEKPLFFLGFSYISQKSLETFWNALGEPLGTPWGGLGVALGALGAALGGFGDAWEALGTPWEAFLGRPALEDLGKALKDLPEATSSAKPPNRLSPISL